MTNNIVSFLIIAIFFPLWSCQHKEEEQKHDSTQDSIPPYSVQKIPQTNSEGDFSWIDLLAEYDRSTERFDEFWNKHEVYWTSYVSGEDESWENQALRNENDWESFVQQQRQEWDLYTSEQIKIWESYTEKEREEWNKYVEEVENKWGAFLSSTRYEWVLYSDNKESRSYVNFKDGYLVFEAAVDNRLQNQMENAQSQLRNMIESAFQEDDLTGQPILDDQISSQQDLLKLTQDPIPHGVTTGKDGIIRSRYAIAMEMVPEHLWIRAERYLGIISKYTSEYNLDKSLVLAIIETESCFNPRAASWANAYGLMQIVPKYAGRETWLEIYGRYGVPSSQYLFNPDNNIKHGCCYLSLLYGKHWKNVMEGNKKDYTVICSYNCGPHNVQKMVFSRFGPPENHSETRLFDLLTSYTPKETRNYLKKVTQKRLKWRTE